MSPMGGGRECAKSKEVDDGGAESARPLLIGIFLLADRGAEDGAEEVARSSITSGGSTGWKSRIPAELLPRRRRQLECDELVLCREREPEKAADGES